MSKTKTTYIADWHDSVSASDILEVFSVLGLELTEEQYKILSKNAQAFWREK